jgi:hypothetical protein
LNTVYGIEYDEIVHDEKLDNFKIRLIDASRTELRRIETFQFNILIILEDSGTAYDYYTNLMLKMYPFLRTKIVSSNGFGSIKKTLETFNTDDITHVIVVYDSGGYAFNVLSVNKQLSDYKHANLDKSKKVTVFKPACFEETLLSFTELDTMAKIDHTLLNYNSYKDFIDIITNKGLMDYNLYINNHSISKSAEEYFERMAFDILHKTKYYVLHSSNKLSNCWMNNCCIYSHKMNCDYLGTSGQDESFKTEMIATMSITYGFIIIIDSVLGFRFRHNKMTIKKEILKHFIGKL